MGEWQEVCGLWLSKSGKTYTGKTKCAVPEGATMTFSKVESEHPKAPKYRISYIVNDDEPGQGDDVPTPPF